MTSVRTRRAGDRLVLHTGTVGAERNALLYIVPLGVDEGRGRRKPFAVLGAYSWPSRTWLEVTVYPGPRKVVPRKFSRTVRLPGGLFARATAAWGAVSLHAGVWR